MGMADVYQRTPEEKIAEIRKAHTEQGAAFQDLINASANLKRQLVGAHKRKWELLQENADLKLRLERTVRKSKGLRMAIRGYRQALFTERLRHGYIVPEDMTEEQRTEMLRDIATYKVKCEEELRRERAKK